MYYKREACKGQTRLLFSLKKYGWKNHKFEIIHKCNPDELNALEIYYIKLYDTFGTRMGLNLREGGYGGKFTDESKKRQSISALKACENPERYNALIKQLSKTCWKSGKESPTYGTGKKIFQFDLGGKLIAMHISAYDIAKTLKIKHSHIYSCCYRHKKFRHYKNYIWRFENDCIIENNILKEDVKPPRIRAICQYSLSGKFIQEFESIKHAKKFIKITSKLIEYCCKNLMGSAHGYRWAYKNNVDVDQLEKSWKEFDLANNKPYIQISLDGFWIGTYYSQNVAAKETNTRQSGISSCILGKIKKTNGFIWK